MSMGPSGPGLSKKTLTKQILQYTAEKMRKNRQKRPKNAKIGSNQLTLRVYAASIFDHVFRLEVDSEPLGPGEKTAKFSDL